MSDQPKALPYCVGVLVACPVHKHTHSGAICGGCHEEFVTEQQAVGARKVIAALYDDLEWLVSTVSNAAELMSEEGVADDEEGEEVELRLARITQRLAAAECSVCRGVPHSNPEAGGCHECRPEFGCVIDKYSSRMCLKGTAGCCVIGPGHGGSYD